MKKIIVLLALFCTSFSGQPAKTSWVAIGDSITYLNDHPDETGNRVKKGYLTLVTEQLPELEYINQGHNGWTSGGIAEKIDSLGLVKADVYTVFLGTNDWWQGRPAGTLADYQNRSGNATVSGSFRIIVDKIRSLNPDARIILITPLRRSDFVYLTDMNNNAYGSYKAKNNQMLEQVVQAITNIGKLEKFPVADLFHSKAFRYPRLVRFKRLRNPKTGEYLNYTYPSYLSVPFDPKRDEYPYPPEAIDMTYDGLHPSDKGNKAIAAILVKLLKSTKN